MILVIFAVCHAQYFSTNGSQGRARGGGTVLHMAVQPHGSSQLFASLLASLLATPAGREVVAHADAGGCTALDLAIARGACDVVLELLNSLPPELIRGLVMPPPPHQNGGGGGGGRDSVPVQSILAWPNQEVRAAVSVIHAVANI